MAGEVDNPTWLSPDQAARVATALEMDPPPTALWPLIREGRLIWKGRFRLDQLPAPINMRTDPEGKTVADLISHMRDEG